ncbi:hypothetical protein AAMO2058_001399600 [Amorphochlora amoebiformis]
MTPIQLGYRSGLCTFTILALQIVVMAQCGSNLIGKISRGKEIGLELLISAWVTFAFGFALIYLVIFMEDPEAFRVEGWIGGVGKHTKVQSAEMEGHVGGVCVAFLYFSISTLTTLGFGDITCRTWQSQTVACVEMMVGVFLTIILFGSALYYFQRQIDVENGAHQPQSFDHDYGCIRRSFRYLRHKVPAIEMFRRFLIDHLLSVVIGVQVFTFVLVLLLDPKLLNDPTVYAANGFITLCVMQGLLLLLLISVSIRIVFKMHDHADIGLWFLVQSYISIIVLFEGVYLLVYLCSRDAFHITVSGGEDMTISGAMWNFLYLSITSMTTTGYGDITPRLMIARIAVSVHMCVSEVYHILILGLGTARFTARQRGVNKGHGGRQMTWVGASSQSNVNDW